MKVFIAILAIVALVNADDEWKPRTADEIKAIRAECIKESPLDLGDIEKMKRLEFPNTAPVRQYLLCTSLKMDIFCPHEGYHPDRIAKQFKMDMEQSEVLAIAEGCVDKNEQGSPNDVWAFRGHQCLMKSKVGDKVRSYIKRKQEEAAKAAAAAATGSSS